MSDDGPRVGIVPGTSTIRIPGYGAITLSDWIDDRHWSTIMGPFWTSRRPSKWRTHYALSVSILDAAYVLELKRVPSSWFLPKRLSWRWRRITTVWSMPITGEQAVALCPSIHDEIEDE